MIRETHGTIQSVNPREKVIVLKNTAGREETMHLGLGSGAAIDSNMGLRPFSDLRVGQQVTIEFGDPGEAYLVRLEH